MQPSLIRASVVAKRTIFSLRASPTRHWLHSRESIIAQSQPRCMSTETEDRTRSNGPNSKRREFVLPASLLIFGEFSVLTLCTSWRPSTHFSYSFFFGDVGFQWGCLSCLWHQIHDTFLSMAISIA